MFFCIAITLATLAFASANPSFALGQAPTRYQKGYNDGCVGIITVPGSHTSEYLKVNAQACHHQNNLLCPLLPQDFHSLEEIANTIVQDIMTEQYKQIMMIMPIVTQMCQCVGHTTQYCQGFVKVYNNEVGDLHQKDKYYISIFLAQIRT